MEYNTFLSKVIDDGIEAAKEDYKDPKDADKLQGSLDGFNICRNMGTDQLLNLLSIAQDERVRAYDLEDQAYWRVRCKEAEIEWVTNCVAAFCYLTTGTIPEGFPFPTVRGAMKAADVLGYKRPWTGVLNETAF